MLSLRPIHTAVIAALAAVPALLTAQQTRSFVDDLVTDFSSGNYTTSTLTQDGFVLPPIEKLRLSGITAEIAWDVVEHNDARYVATGHEGRLFRQRGIEDAAQFVRFSEPALYAISALADDRIAVAASPGGMIYTVDDAGTTTTLAKLDAAIIWDLLADDAGLVAATGTPASLVRVAPDGTTSTIAKFERPINALSVAAIPGTGDFAVATQGPGTVARVFADGTIRVLIDPEQEEVRRVVVGADGSVFAAVNGVRSPGERLLGQAPEQARAAGNQKPRPESFVVRVWPDGFAEEWWTSPESPIHDLSLRPDGSLIIAAGGNGAVFRVSPGRVTHHLGIADEKFITRLRPAADGDLLAVTGADASLWRLNPDRHADGEFQSRVFDVNGVARWGRARAILSANGGTIRAAFRVGNTREPDATWGEWSELVDFAAGEAAIDRPTARFIQYKLAFGAAPSGASQPTVDAVRLFYAQPNVAPRLGEIKIEPQRPKSPAEAAQARGKFDVTWPVVEPNQDTLLFDVQLLSPAGGNPLLLAEGISQPRHTIDALELPDGRYRVRVIARDTPSNPLGAEAVTESTSQSFLVDNTPPSILVESTERISEGVNIRFGAVDAIGLVTSATWRIPGSNPRPILPEDGFFDSPTATFELTLTGDDAKSGTVVLLTVGDENDNRSYREIVLP
jgi:hypothetical protein